MSARRRGSDAADSSSNDIVPLENRYLPNWMHAGRTRVLWDKNAGENTDNDGGGDDDDDSISAVWYWMQREVRTEDNWALLLATHLANMHKLPLQVCYCAATPHIIKPSHSSVGDSDNDDDSNTQMEQSNHCLMTEREAAFTLGGLQLVEKELNAQGVPLKVVLPSSNDQVGQAVNDLLASSLAPSSSDPSSENVLLVCDFHPLRRERDWLEGQLVENILQQNASTVSSPICKVIQVDAHNVVPVWIAAEKQQVGARTLRPKINVLLSEYMTSFHMWTSLIANNHHHNEKSSVDDKQKVDWDAVRDFLGPFDETVKPVKWAEPGREAAMAQFKTFLSKGLKDFDKLRNDPNLGQICSNLSPWINHGHVSFQRLALDVRKLNKYSNGTAAYIEEGIVRRELSDNFLFYNSNYDSLEGAAGWAQETLQVHASDPREWTYSLEELEEGRTHDALWNAAQLQCVRHGKMHGFMRMYWAKKILEWTEAGPAAALAIAQYLNDKYNIDGNDPNGFVGVGWSIMGIHDMGWKERPIFGKIRYMNYAGCKRKFDVQSFVTKYPGALENAIEAAGQRGKEPEGVNKSKKKKATSNPASRNVGKKRKAGKL